MNTSKYADMYSTGGNLNYANQQASSTGTNPGQSSFAAAQQQPIDNGTVKRQAPNLGNDSRTYDTLATLGLHNRAANFQAPRTQAVGLPAYAGGAVQQAPAPTPWNPGTVDPRYTSVQPWVDPSTPRAWDMGEPVPTPTDGAYGGQQPPTPAPTQPTAPTPIAQPEWEHWNQYGEYVANWQNRRRDEMAQGRMMTEPLMNERQYHTNRAGIGLDVPDAFRAPQRSPWSNRSNFGKGGYGMQPYASMSNRQQFGQMGGGRPIPTPTDGATGTEFGGGDRPMGDNAQRRPLPSYYSGGQPMQRAPWDVEPGGGEGGYYAPGNEPGQPGHNTPPPGWSAPQGDEWKSTLDRRMDGAGAAKQQPSYGGYAAPLSGGGAPAPDPQQAYTDAINAYVRQQGQLIGNSPVFRGISGQGGPGASVGNYGTGSDPFAIAQRTNYNPLVQTNSLLPGVARGAQRNPLEYLRSTDAMRAQYDSMTRAQSLDPEAEKRAMMASLPGAGLRAGGRLSYGG